tara:strand:+ start:591 stop:1544 length:954 start_codon:yes stop_codon:yes gene_type:complete
MKPKSIVLGCTGQDGSYLCKSLLDQGFDVVGTTTKKYPNLERLSTLKITDKFKVLYCDLEDFDQIKKIINKINPIEIYNLSAQSSVGSSFKKPIETHKSIVNATLNILEACRELNFKGNIFFAGSSEIFGSTKIPANLNSPIDLRSPYATAKYQSFLISKMYRKIYQLNCVTGILFNHESPLRDEKFVIKKIINKSIKIKKGSKEKLILGDITIKRDWGYAKEYVEAFQLINRSELNRDYLICTGKSHSLQTIIEKIFNKLNLDWTDHVEVRRDLYRSNEIESSLGDPKQIYKDLGWKSKIHIDELIQKLLDDEIHK